MVKPRQMPLQTGPSEQKQASLGCDGYERQTDGRNTLVEVQAFCAEVPN